MKANCGEIGPVPVIPSRHRQGEVGAQGASEVGGPWFETRLAMTLPPYRDDG